MRITTVFNRLLKLQGAQVRSVHFVKDRIEVRVTRRARRHRCPLCEHTSSAAYDRCESSWRHVGLGSWKVVIRTRRCRLWCPKHGVITEAVPWAEHGARLTRDFDELVTWLAREMSKSAVERLMHIAWRTVGRIVTRTVNRHLDQRRLDKLYLMGIDEVSYRKGHKYLTVIANHQRGEPVWLGEGRKRKTVGAFFDELGAKRTGDVVVASMDMCAPYIEEVKERAPDAIITFDPFHVVKMASDAVQKVRRAEARERKGTSEAEVLKGSRWLLLKAPEKLRPEEKLRLSAVAQLNKCVYRAYLLKEELRALYRCHHSEAKDHLDAWLAWASRSRLHEFVRVARTLRKYRTGVLQAIYWKLSNSRMEGINNKIGVVKRRAYGFHSATALIAMVYLCCTKLDIKLPI